MGWFAKLFSTGEERALRQSFARPVVRCYQRDAFRYYENGRWVTVDGELMSGCADVERVIFRRCPLKWNDTGEALTTEERAKVFQKVGEHLDKSGIKWKFDDGRSA
jgi:hypothetical protein